MRRISFCRTAAVILCFAAQSKVAVQIAKGTVQTNPVQVATNAGPVQADLREARVALQFPSGKIGFAHVTILYEPKSRLFWWRYQTIESEMSLPEKFLIYIDQDRVVAFSFSRPNLWVRESTAHCSSLNDAEAKVLTEIRGRVVEIERGTVQWARPINIGRMLGSDFLALKGSASPFPQPTLREIHKREGQWHVILDGPNRDTGEVVLDDKFELISATVLPAQAP